LTSALGREIRTMEHEFRKGLMQKIALFILMGILPLLPAQGLGQVADRIVAVVNDDIIFYSELEESGKRLFEQVKQTALPSERETKLRKAREAILEQLIGDKLLAQEIKKRKIEVSEREVDAALQEDLQRNRMTEAQFKMALAKEGMTYSLYRQNIRDYIGKMRLMSREIRSKIVIPDEDVRKVYQERIKEYTDPLEVKVQQIFFAIPKGASEQGKNKVRQEAQLILDQTRQGEDFANLAREYSQGAEAKEGGVLGFFKPEELIPEMEEAVTRLKPGEVSDLVLSPEGFHILRVMERKGGEPKPLAEVQAKIRDELSQKEAERLFNDMMKSLKEKAYIEVRL
jgi:peptidyl-prolyl cis-trans isomerase SurA